MDTNNRLRAIWHGLARSGRYTEFVDDSDYQTFDRRLLNEGAEFYARGLTSLRTAFLVALEKGTYEAAPPGFKSRKGSRLPAFLHRAHRGVFSDDGDVLGVVNADAVACLNQLLAVFGKIEGGHTEQSERDVISTFVKNESEVKEFNDWIGDLDTQYTKGPNASCCWYDGLPSPLDRYKYRLIRGGYSYILETLDGGFKSAGNHVNMHVFEARRLVRAILSGENPLDITPKHGSGASADGLPPYQRYGRPRYIKKLDAVYPYSEYFYLSPTHLCDALENWVDTPGASPYQNGIASEEYDPCAKVLLVPKDARGPRLISCEPRETMWIQQGLMAKLVTCLEAHPLTRGLVNFTDQQCNRILAWRGSINRETSTLDLKDASDRISWKLVQNIWPKNWVECLSACRSDHTMLPDGTKVTLEKFAPMGSALCFPVMALTIWALLTAAANAAQTSQSVRAQGNLKKVGRPYKWKNPVYVYGDDIVVRTDFADAAMRVLEAVGLAVNRNKSFARSLFRESCGGEYYNGWDVTPVRLRALPDDTVPSRMKVIAFHNNIVARLAFQPYWLTELIHSWYPLVPEKTRWNISEMPRIYSNVSGEMPSLFVSGVPLLGYDDESANQLEGVLEVDSPDNSRLRSRFVKRYYRREYRALVGSPKGTKYPKDRWCQVFRAVVNPRRYMTLGWDALAKRVVYKYRWLALR